MTITEFLLARIDEDEARAQAAADSLGTFSDHDRVGPDWLAVVDDFDGRGMVTSGLDPTGQCSESLDLWDNEGAGSLSMRAPAALHVAAFDPARVLRECQAKRTILAEHPRHERLSAREHPAGYACSTCVPDGIYRSGAAVQKAWPCPTVRTLAAVYRDHSGYDPAWEGLDQSGVSS